MPLYFANALGSKQEAKYKDVNAMIKARGTEAVQERLQFLSEGKRWEQESSRRSSSGMRRSLA